MNGIISWVLFRKQKGKCSGVFISKKKLLWYFSDALLLINYFRCKTFYHKTVLHNELFFLFEEKIFSFFWALVSVKMNRMVKCYCILKQIFLTFLVQSWRLGISSRPSHNINYLWWTIFVILPLYLNHFKIC